VASVIYHNLVEGYKPLNLWFVKRWFRHLLTNHNRKRYNLNIIYCTDEYLLEINKNHLGHDYYTDIITFDLSEPDSKLTEADIYISVERIQENANQNKVEVENETIRVLAHGILHLLGYKDKTDAEIKEMRNKEEESISLYHETNSKVPRGTGSRKSISRQKNK
jgi:rRNA maturation RNase YbeY